MAALTQDTVRIRNHVPIMVGEAKVGASKTIFAGSMVARLAATGFAEAAFTSTTIKVLGVAIRGVVNGTTAGAVSVGYEAGDFEFANSTAGDLLAQVDVGNNVYVVDDNTVAKTDGTGTRSIAGILVGFGPITGLPVVRVGLGLGST